MKKYTLLFILLPFLGLSQIQIGQNIVGESVGERSGRSCSISSDGSTVVVGAMFNSENASAAGRAGVFQNVGGIWTQVGQSIYGNNSNDFVGRSTSISSDGNIIAVGSPGNNGRVRVYENIGGVWIQQGQDIEAVTTNEQFGNSIDLSSDGSIIAIGGSQYDTFRGIVRVYENIGGVWTQIGEDIDSNSGQDSFGFSLSLSTDGSIVAVGGYTYSGIEDIAGHVIVYRNIGGSWTQIGQNIVGESISPDDWFGWSVDLSSNGSIVAIGSPEKSINGNDSGQVKVYENIDEVWTQVGQDINGDNAEDELGFSLSLSSDGSIIAVGARQFMFNSEPGFGYVKILKNTNGTWSQLGSNIFGEVDEDLSGWSVALSSQANVVAIGSPNNDENVNNSGHVRVYDLSELLSTEEVTITNFSIFPNPAKNQFTIQLNDTSALEKVTIYNTLGQEVLRAKTSVVNTSELTSGMYIVKITTNTGKASKTLIIE